MTQRYDASTKHLVEDRLADWLALSELTSAAPAEVINADLATAYFDADPMADRLGITYAVRQRLRLRTIGSTDLRKGGRENRRRRRWNTKRKKVKADQADPEAARRSHHQNGRRRHNMGDLARKASRHRLFRDLDDAPRQVRRIVDKLEKSGDLGTRLEPRERGGSERYI